MKIPAEYQTEINRIAAQERRKAEGRAKRIALEVFAGDARIQEFIDRMNTKIAESEIRRPWHDMEYVPPTN
jgi:hypothetical protein